MDADPAFDGLTSDPEWEQYLVEGHRPFLLTRAVMRRLPSAPRCKVCSSPFRGIGGRVGRLAGFSPSRKNPNICGRCDDELQPGGALVDIGVLFADIRGSTAMGESLPATSFAGALQRFYGLATDVLLSHDAVIDKLLGDEVMALFIPGVTGQDYRRKTVEAGLDLVRTANRDSRLRDTMSLGVAVHAGPAFVGMVGAAGVVDFTALGDTVNTGARLQALAQPNELVVSEELCLSLSDPRLDCESRLVELKGKADPFPIRVLHL